MAPWTTDRLAGTAITGAIELYLLFKIWQSLRRGVVSVTFGTRAAGESYTHLKAHRDELPVFYWILVVFLALTAAVVGGIVALVAGGFVT